MSKGTKVRMSGSRICIFRFLVTTGVPKIMFRVLDVNSAPVYWLSSSDGKSGSFSTCSLVTLRGERVWEEWRDGFFFMKIMFEGASRRGSIAIWSRSLPHDSTDRSVFFRANLNIFISLKIEIEHKLILECGPDCYLPEKGNFFSKYLLSIISPNRKYCSEKYKLSSNRWTSAPAYAASTIFQQTHRSDEKVSGSCPKRKEINDFNIYFRWKPEHLVDTLLEIIDYYKHSNTKQPVRSSFPKINSYSKYGCVSLRFWWFLI